jgi:hypothetical protein
MRAVEASHKLDRRSRLEQRFQARTPDGGGSNRQHSNDRASISLRHFNINITWSDARPT